MFRQILLFASLIVLAVAQTPVRECGNGRNPPLNMRFRDCVQEPCIVIRGQPATSYIRFTSPINSAVMRPSVRGTWLGISVDVNIPEDQVNGCNHLEGGESCPLEAGQTYDYMFTLAPAMNDPLVTAEQEFTLFGENNEVLVCYRVRNTVTNP